MQKSTTALILTFACMLSPIVMFVPLLVLVFLIAFFNHRVSYRYQSAAKFFALGIVCIPIAFINFGTAYVLGPFLYVFFGISMYHVISTFFPSNKPTPVNHSNLMQPTATEPTGEQTHIVEPPAPDSVN